MMTGTGQETWQRANDDAISTDSGSSDPEMNLRPRTSESSLLRGVPTFRNVVPEKRKGLIAALLFTIVVIVCISFGTLYNTGGDDAAHKVIAAPLTNIVVPDLVEAAEPQTDKSASDVDDYQSDPPSELIHSKQNGTRRRKSKKPKKANNRNNQAHHGPRKLPENAQEKKNVFSLLYQVKLADGDQNNFVNYTICNDVDIDKRQLFKGWKADLTVNLAGAGFNSAEHRNVFIGYGTKQSDARRRAAQNAFTELYPGELEYSEKDDLKDIEPFCKNDENEDINQNQKGSSTTSHTPKTPTTLKTPTTSKSLSS